MSVIVDLFYQVYLLTVVLRFFRGSWHGSVTTRERQSVQSDLGILSCLNEMQFHIQVHLNELECRGKVHLFQ